MKIAREAWPIVTIVVVFFAALALLLHPWAASAGLPLLAFVLWFFRDPERRTPDEPGLLISPADGRILRAGPRRISVFMNVFNVHVCRAPEAGRVEAVERHDGSFRAAWHDHASEQNERVTIRLGDGPDASRFTLVAGLIARRIVCKVSRGEQVSAGQRIGLIQFGSRVDVDLPQGAEVVVSVGQRVFAGRTPIARRG